MVEKGALAQRANNGLADGCTPAHGDSIADKRAGLLEGGLGWVRSKGRDRGETLEESTFAEGKGAVLFGVTEPTGSIVVELPYLRSVGALFAFLGAGADPADRVTVQAGGFGNVGDSRPCLKRGEDQVVAG